MDRDVPPLFSSSLLSYFPLLLFFLSLQNGRREKQLQAGQRHEPQGLEHCRARCVGPARRVRDEFFCFPPVEARAKRDELNNKKSNLGC